MVISAALEKKLVSMRRDSSGGWDERTQGKAPHKPFLLLAVLDLVEVGVVRENLVRYEDELLVAFDLYWSECFPDRVTNPAQPFWYLKGDGFWSLVARPGYEERLQAMQDGGKVPSLAVLREVVAGARLEAELFELALTPSGRECVRGLLIGAHFSAETRLALAARHAVVVEAHRCASELRRRTERELGELFLTRDPLDAAFTEESRSIAFRAVVVDAYAHRCAVCDAHVRTPSGRSAVEAAHIVPFAKCHSNDPRNGLALCGSHHWAFDNGMLTVRASHRIKVHRYAHELPADPAFLALDGRSIRLPADPKMAPAASALEWHEREVFGRAG